MSRPEVAPVSSAAAQGAAQLGGPRVGYVLKRYPRYSETFIVNEILAHEAAGTELRIFSLYPPADTHFQDAISRVRAPVTYLGSVRPKVTDLWGLLLEAQTVGLSVDALLASVQPAHEDARDACWALELALAVRKQHTTHLHAHFASGATTVARLAAGLAGVSYSFTAHAKDIFHESVSDDDLRRKLGDAAAVVTVSDFNQGYLQARFGEAAAEVQRIYNGMDLSRFPYASPEVRPPEIVAVGRLVEKKGFADLLRACVLLRERGEVFRCRIIGTGELEGALLEQIVQLGLEETVDLLGPRLQRELAGYLQNAAAFAAPCVVGEDGNRDGLPTVLLEAMALGTPCVSTDVTGISEVLADGVIGLEVPQHRPDALADALAQLLHDGALRVRLAAARRLLVGTGPEAARLGQGDAAEFTGAVAPERVPALLARMDVAVVPYLELKDFYFSPLNAQGLRIHGRRGAGGGEPGGPARRTGGRWEERPPLPAGRRGRPDGRAAAALRRRGAAGAASRAGASADGGALLAAHPQGAHAPLGRVRGPLRAGDLPAARALALKIHPRPGDRLGAGGGRFGRPLSGHAAAPAAPARRLARFGRDRELSGAERIRQHGRFRTHRQPRPDQSARQNVPPGLEVQFSLPLHEA